MKATMSAPVNVVSEPGASVLPAEPGHRTARRSRLASIGLVLDTLAPSVSSTRPILAKRLRRAVRCPGSAGSTLAPGSETTFTGALMVAFMAMRMRSRRRRISITTYQHGRSRAGAPNRVTGAQARPPPQENRGPALRPPACPGAAHPQAARPTEILAQNAGRKGNLLRDRPGTLSTGSAEHIDLYRMTRPRRCPVMGG